MAFAGKYELESQEMYEEFLEAIGLLKAKTDHKVSQRCSRMETPLHGLKQSQTGVGVKFKAPVTLENGKLSIQFPQYHFTAEIVDNKLVMTCVTAGEKGVTFKRVNKRI
ncbi:hypothetical protein WMY93_009751 [Mugilogobius chulae]|uniref:Uncharacterized protein n=1 Tax=Mugilogobius chulae TaxID=88201 RepID=A0AAW0PCD8_9GOBI